MIEKRPSLYLDNKVREQKEKEIAWKGSIGFDFIFVRDGYDENGKEKRKPICIEINGSNSGIAGIQEIDEKKIPYLEKLFARLRGEENQELRSKERLLKKFVDDYFHINGRQIDEEEMFDSETGFSPKGLLKVQEYIRNIKRKIAELPLFEKAHPNPLFIALICSDKILQSKYIPEEYQSPPYIPGKREKSSTGLWIVKPTLGLGGNNIKIFNDQQLQTFLKYPNSANYHISEMLDSLGAQEAEEIYKNNPASFRLLLDFIVTKDGEIIIEEGKAYQRVAQSSGEDDVYERIVNKSNGAVSAMYSEEEIGLATPVALQIIENLHNAYQKELELSSVDLYDTV